MKGYIYKLYNDDDVEFYVGSCKDIKERKRTHKYNSNNPKSKKYNSKVYKY
jgi:predicted GIY-YIG superfamily endonuclease